MDMLKWMNSPNYRKLEFVEEEAAAGIPGNFVEPNVLFDLLIRELKKYHPSNELDIIYKAYDISKEAHKEQKRNSGEPYIIHPLCVAIILAQLEMDKETIVAGILHDVVEDTRYTVEDITELFGAEIALLVDGVTKLTKINYMADKVERQAENLRKMFLAMAKDIRVIIIKLADRLHNMRTLGFMKPEKQREKSRETMDIYSPIAHRLGISKVKIELDDLALKYLEPEVYEDLQKNLDSMRVEKEEFIRKIVADVSENIKNSNIEAKIDGRVKHLFSIYKKMKNQNKSLEQIYDLFAVRIIVETDQDCYAALGVIHEMYKPIPGRFKDYIAMPKQNMYQSLHTTLIGPEGQPFEIQIRTYEMHRTAEYGIAAHWKYKEGADGKKSQDSEEAKLTWLREILEWQHEMSDNKEFMSLLKSDLDLFSDSVYCFTPSGDVKNLPAGSTPIDFAYSIHSAVGNMMIGARVNGNLVTIDYQIQNGDQVEIITSNNSRGPSRDWLKLVKSTQAKNKINQWFRAEFKEENISRGKELLAAYAKNKGIPLHEYLKNEYTEPCLRKYGFRDWDALLASVGHGGLKEGQIVNKLLEEHRKKTRNAITDRQIIDKIEENNSKPQDVKNMGNHNKSGIVVEGIDDLAVRFSKCCSPVPGDEIVGFVTRGRGISIHRTDCINVINVSEADRKRIIEAEWRVPENKGQKEMYDTEIVVFSENRNGVLLDITKLFTEKNIEVKYMNMRTSKKEKLTIVIGFEVESKEFLRALVEKIRMIESVIDIERV
ncbi:MAG: bifunctional (p)ppGpp synthetase/guanosine-3',5'-bis(diphosphate) 3'-pyrophosphohydrolase [Lachnospiraceae bacterium]|nr:bifunctional (p)ppGpp synthetase/guanosine-3',5'-bis(diphosphate) 3'-pyrophosphohydrolase [Lachnospiraceae bacterium]